ncbi:MAG: hypothetical protein GDA44_14190 [Prochloron sp. SP5CPC1]|nr:hypothetical protein [Candidatus Paraprochloron terpiosi SP5CPC1]
MTLGSHVASFYPVGLVGLVVYLDENKNGRRDSNELYTLTDADGYYSLSIPEGIYILGLEIPPGWVQLSGANSTYEVIVTNNETVHLDFPLTKGSTDKGLNYRGTEDTEKDKRGSL